jgi:hypothetical protein
MTTGHVFFFWTPNRSGTGARGLGIASASMFLVVLMMPLLSCGLQCTGFAIGSGGRSAAGIGQVIWLLGSCANLVGGLIAIGYFFVWMLFLRSVAAAMGASGTGWQAVIYMILYPLYLIMSVLSSFGVFCIGGTAFLSSLTSTANNPNQGGGNVAAVGTGWIIAMIAVHAIIVLVFLGMMIWYLVILHMVRGSISRKVS